MPEQARRKQVRPLHDELGTLGPQGGLAYPFGTAVCANEDIVHIPPLSLAYSVVLGRGGKN